MKILNRDDFLKMPSGTMYQKGVPWAFDNLSVKADTLVTNDFVTIEIGAFESADDASFSNMLELALAEGTSIPMSDDFCGRDGCFEKDAIFKVLEAADLLVLRAMIDAALIAHGSDGDAK